MGSGEQLCFQYEQGVILMKGYAMANKKVQIIKPVFQHREAGDGLLSFKSKFDINF